MIVALVFVDVRAFVDVLVDADAFAVASARDLVDVLVKGKNILD